MGEPILQLDGTSRWYAVAPAVDALSLEARQTLLLDLPNSDEWRERQRVAVTLARARIGVWPA
jgi:hypothetical protein